MINLHLEKLYRYPRIMEPMWIAVPVKKGQLSGASDVSVYDGTEKLPVQTKVTARYDDGSVRFLFTRFMGNLPGNSAKDFSLYLDEKDRREYVEDSAVQECASDAGQLVVTQNADGFAVDTGTLCFRVKNFSENLFDTLMCGRQLYEREQFLGPYLCDGMGTKYNVTIDRWRVVEEGNVCTILAATGSNDTEFGGCEESNHYRFEIRVTAYAGKPWLEISYRLFNTSESPLKIKSLVFSVMSGNGMEQDITLADMNDASYIDSTGCGDISEAIENENALVYRTRGTKELLHIEELAPAQGVRTCAGASNYKTDFVIGRDGTQVNKAAYDKALLMEGNEHMAEVLYGTFFADRTDADGGVCATIFQAQQNYPKAVKADKDGVYVMLVPEGFNDVVMQSGMAREQRFMLHFHEADEHIAELDNRSLIYQMPDRPIIAPYVYKNSGAVPDVFADKVNADIDMLLISKADARARSLGMLNWGDTIDWNYTKQGRGGGAAVWVNNEYDFPHACALMYMRMGIRRYLDFCMVHASHWMDVDVCHYSADPLKIGGLTEHTKGMSLTELWFRAMSGLRAFWTIII